MTPSISFYWFARRSFHVDSVSRAARSHIIMAGDRGVKRPNRDQDISPPPLKRKNGDPTKRV